MIDLSFLSEEEQETIRSVLIRDAQLKKAEEQRIQNLQRTVSDRDQLRYMTGEWFYETKQLRHEDRIHGSDIIRASMRQTHKPLTILERSQILPERPSFVSSENEEVFVPPVLCGLLQEPRSNETYQNQNFYETLRDMDKPDVQSPTRQRKNPFNTEITASDTFEGKELLDGALDQTKTPPEESFPSSGSSIFFASALKQDPGYNPFTQNAYVPINSSVSNSSQEVDGPEDRETNFPVSPRGILKHLFTYSPLDSPFSHLDPQSPVSLNSPTETWKQVRFSSVVGQSSVDWHDGKELGEYSVLDVDSIAPSEVENNRNLEHTVSTTVRTGRPLVRQSKVDSQEGEQILQEQEAGQHQVPGDVSEHCQSEFQSPAVYGRISPVQESGKPVLLETEPEDDCHSQAVNWPTGHIIHHQTLPEQSTDISDEATSDTKPSSSSKGSSHTVSPKARQRLLGLFRREKHKPAQKEDVKISTQEEPGNTQNRSQVAADTTKDKPASVEQEAKPSETMEVRTLQLTALQNTPLKETGTSVEADAEADTRLEATTEDRVVTGRLHSLKGFWKRENRGPKIFTSEETRHKDIFKITPDLDFPQTNSNVESNNNVSPQSEMSVKDTDGTSQENSRLFVDSSKEDGTYRANPVVIDEETDDSLTGSVTESQIFEIKEDFITPVSSSVAFNTTKQERGIPVPLPRQSTSSLEEDKPAKIDELKHFWKKEPKVIAARAKEASRIPVLSDKVVSPQSDLRTSLDSREKSEGEVQTRSSVVLKSLKVTDKGFISPERSHAADAEAQEKPLSPSKSPTPTPRLKDQEDVVRRSPSKTCHPRVLPRESSSPTKSRLEGSPLKTFPININPQTKAAEEHQGKVTPVPKPRKTGRQEALMDVKPLPVHVEDRGAYFGDVNTSSLTSPQSIKASGNKLGTSTPLARSFIPQDYQHYLGPQEKAHVPPFHQDKAAAESAAAHRPQNALRDHVGNHSDNPAEGNPPGISSRKDGNSSHDKMTWSLPRASSGSHDETSNPVASALKRLSLRSMSSSKSVENLISETNVERTQKNSSDQMNQSMDDVSSLPPSLGTLSNSKQMKASASVPALQHDETDSDSTFENSLGCRRNTGSSMSNISLSSGMASMSSISGSISNIYFGDVEVQGSIQFAVNYIQKLGELHIFVVHCRDLAVAETKKNHSDPYVKCYLLPDKTKLGKRKTTVKKKTLNPNFNEILRFKVLMEVLKTQDLNISVWHNDTFGRNSFLGEVDLDLSEWDFSNTQINEYTLKARVSAQTSAPSPSHLMDSRGQMKVALRFLPQTSHSKRTSRMETGEVQIWVKDCKNLPPVRGVIIDPFVKCTVLPDTSRKSRQKTRVVKRTANPMFNHTMVYDGFRPEDLKEACAEITVWDHDRLNNHYIGGLRLGLGTGKSYGTEVVWMDSTAGEADLWQRMLQSDGEWVEDVLPLRMFVMAKSTSK
ncbi:Synaptotagmin-like protein 2 [Larimichthys crocea]|uniref:Synaptotagmin-like protein 2 n=2 Tax=Larimichthys crocea TaxID=215358 RepID=A0A6G0IA00_LARCR|nr:Synaptotagmin-like protein 2 [Larimichthys crocea]